MDQAWRRPFRWILGAAVVLQLALSPLALAQSGTLPPARDRVGDLRRGPDGRLIPAQPDAAAAPNSAPASPQEPAASTAPPAAAKPKPVAATAPPKPTEAPARQALPCASKAITCIEVESTTTQSQKDVPVTFGQPFAPGDVPAGASIVAEDEAGKPLPLQIDEPATFPDGSLRFAVLSTILPELGAGARRGINLLRSTAPAKSTPGREPAALLGAGYDLAVDVVAYEPQVTRLQFGDRGKAKFDPGEVLTVALGDAPEDRHTLTLTQQTSGVSWEGGQKVAVAFMEQINRSKNFRAYKIGEGGGYDYLWVTRREPPGKAFTVKITSTGSAPIGVLNLSEHVPERRYGVTLRRLLDQARKRPATWLDGPVATEFSLASPLLDQETGKAHPRLAARMNVRVYAGAKNIRADLVVENAWTFEKNQGNQPYNVTVLQDGKAVFTKSALNHFHHARWHKVFWRNEPSIRLSHDLAYFMKSRAVWNYDRTIRVSGSALSELQKRLAASDTGPMGSAIIAQYFPTTGARDDIGPVPKWSAIFLLTQDQGAKAAVLAVGDASGSVPVHYRDQSTDQPVRIDDHPKGVIPFYGHLENEEIFPHPANGDTPWTVDSAHQPSLAYLPYLITGDEYYLEEIMYWANFNMLIMPPGLRQHTKGLIYYNQIRGEAWSLRSLANAAQILPNRHPMKSYFVGKLNENLRWYVEHYVRNPDREVSSALAYIERPDGPDGTAPWMVDFVALVVGQLAESGDALATELFRWMARFTVGRWTHQAQGFCRAMAPSMVLKIRTKEGRAIQDWETLFKVNFPNVTQCPSPTAFPEGSFPGMSVGYVAISRAMLAMAVDFKIEGALEAYQQLRADTTSATAGMANDPTFAIAPRN